MSFRMPMVGPQRLLNWKVYRVPSIGAFADGTPLIDGAIAVISRRTGEEQHGSADPDEASAHVSIVDPSCCDGVPARLTKKTILREAEEEHIKPHAYAWPAAPPELEGVDNLFSKGVRLRNAADRRR